MSAPRGHRRILLLEWIGFALVVLALWLDEFADLPHLLLGSPRTPINGGELAIETFLVLALAVTVTARSYALLRRLKHLEAQVHVCAFCSRVRDGERWVALEDYLREHAETQLAQSMCHDCLVTRFAAAATPPGGGDRA